MTIHNSLPDAEAAPRFEAAIREALDPEDGSFAAWITLEGSSVRIHLEEPARKETLGGVVQPWKRSVHLKIDSSADEVRERIAKLRST